MLFNKKGQVAGINVAFVIVAIFILMGVVLPFTNAAFNINQSEELTNNFETDISQPAGGDVNAVTAFEIVKSVFRMFFWYGDLPFGIDAVLLIFRVILLLILIQYLPFVG